MTQAKVEVGGEVVGQISQGLLVLLCVERGDTQAQAAWMAQKIATLRIFSDEAGKMNLSVQDVGGAVLLVSQFTLAGKLEKGTRPSFITAELPEPANALFEYTCALLRATPLPVETGRFGADMQVSLVNDGPVTILLER